VLVRRPGFVGFPVSCRESPSEVPDGVTVFDDRYPAVADLDPRLLDALRTAARDAEHDDVRFYVVSGWRSRRHQEQLFAEAVATYGSVQQAARWVAPPGTCAHEVGRAVDLGPSSATAWLSAHGASCGLCQIYANEPWHFELRAAAVTRGCPAMYADPTHDPRMQH
jgi:LAS superfamily LD-carboxypeptidase LdcB